MAVTPTASAARKDRLLTRREIEFLIAEGHKIVIINKKVLKVDAWIPYHPGGDKSILHVVGRDASDEVLGFHTPETLERMERYQIGRIEGYWVNFLPPIQGGKFRTRAELDAAPHDEEDADADTLGECPSSRGSSSAGSPIFDPADEPNSSLRHRKTDQPGVRRVASLSSMSSVELDTKPGEPKMSHLDVLTQEAITLDLDKYPPLDIDTQAEIARKYRILIQRIHDEGLFECRYWCYGIECIRYAILFLAFLFFLKHEWYTTSAFFLGAFWHQVTFVAHDSGHMGITHDFVKDNLIGILVADFIGGLSLGWWKRNHNVHHIVTNSAEHDPDIQHLPFFAISHRFLLSLRSTYYDRVLKYDAVARVMIPVQQYLYYVVLLFGRFNLYRLSWEYLLMGQAPKKGPAAWTRWLELVGQTTFWYWYGYVLVYRTIPTGWTRLAFVLVSHMVTAPLHVQITLSHFAMSTADLGPAESFAQRMLRTTMDVDCPTWLDFFHGGLQYQAIHHLYPRMPRHNLRAAQRLVQAFCDDVGIPYALFGFVDGNREVLGRLADVARQAKILAECQKTMMRNGEVLAGH